ncbi:MAG TPA: TonB family protein, partial [Nitrospirota bacterium]|nr:TonB family protein [Nitrospirota bacterium]
KKLPPLQRPEPIQRPLPIQHPAPIPPVPQRIVPEKPLPPSEVPKPKKFGESEEVKLPKTMPRTGIREGAEEGNEVGKTGSPRLQKHAGPLPFLSQNDIDELARKGMPEKHPGDDSLTLDTEEFKFISYNRWLKIKIESVLKYPELAAISGYEGTLYIKFDILKDGSLGSVDVLKSSGFKILDEEAVRAIRAAAPFQPLPDNWGMQRYSIRAAVIFYVGAGYIQ